MSTPAPERDTQLLSIGQQCSASTCGLIDFLPLKCQHCNQPFCGDHFLPLAHKCDKYDESKHNRVAPSCPLCNTPVAVPPGQDPNVRMERHISTECSVTTGKTKTSSVPHCAQPKCGKLLFSPIPCNDCKKQFCPSHRFSKDHTCIPVSSAKVHKTPATGGSAMAAFKRAVQQPPSGNSAKSSQPRPPVFPIKIKTKNVTPTLPKPPVKVAASASSSSSHKPNLFSKTDRSLILSTTRSTNDTTNDPPQRCTPKSTTHINPLSFAPPPLFGTA